MARKATTTTEKAPEKKAPAKKTAPKKETFSTEYLREHLESKLSRFYGTTAQEATKDQLYKSLLLAVKDILSKKRTDFKKNVNNQRGKKVYYLCMEFLIGKSLRNNIMNLGVEKQYAEILAEMRFEPSRQDEKERMLP